MTPWLGHRSGFIKKLRIALGASAVILLLLTAGQTALSLSHIETASDSTTSGCVQKLKQQFSAAQSTASDAAVLALASGASELISQTGGYAATFLTTMHGWAFDATCTATLTDIDAVFLLRNSTSLAGYAIVYIDPGLTKVIGVFVDLHPQYASSQKDSAAFSGYEFYGNAQQSGLVWEATASFTVPTVDRPNLSACVLTRCAFRPWTGIETVEGGAQMAQAGVSEEVYCPLFCYANNYYAWWEVYPDFSLISLFNVAPSHSVYFDVYDHAAGGGPSNLIDFTALDFTNGQGKTVYYQNWTHGNTYYGGFFAERYSAGTLLTFGQLTMQGSIWFNGALQGIQNPYNSQWFWQVTMNQNCPPNPNIQLGGVSSSSFTQTYINSCGT